MRDLAAAALRCSAQKLGPERGSEGVEDLQGGRDEWSKGCGGQAGGTQEGRCPNKIRYAFSLRTSRLYSPQVKGDLGALSNDSWAVKMKE